MPRFPRPILVPMLVAGLTALVATFAVAPTSATALPTGSTVYVTAGGTGTCVANTVANGLPSVPAAVACATTPGAVIAIGAGSFGTPGSVRASIELPRAVTVQGAGASTTTLVNTVLIDPGATVSITGVTVNTGGFETGIANEGSLTLTNSVVTGNGGDTVTNYGGSGIANVTPGTVGSLSSNYSPSLTVLDSTISNNVDVGGGAGGVALDPPQTGFTDTATFVNSTISGNRSLGSVGGIKVSGSALTVRDSTISANQGISSAAGGLFLSTAGAMASVINTIVATNTATTAGATIASDCLTAAGAVFTAGHDVIGTGAGCSGPNNGSAGNQVGTPAHPINPQLGALTNNGGPTPTQALAPGSPAVRAGDPTDCQAAPASNLDQRGDPRHADTRATCDIGAYDTSSVPRIYYVNAATGTDTTCLGGTTSLPLATLTAALACAATSDTIQIAAGTYGTPNSTSATFVAGNNVTITGASAAAVTVINTVLVAPLHQLTLSGVTVNTGGNETGIANEGSLTLNNSVVTGNGGDIVTNYGASGIANVTPGTAGALSSNYSPSLMVLDSTISNNVDASGGAGGIALDPPQTGFTDTATIVNSTISGNRSFGSVGGIKVTGSVLTVRDSTISANQGISSTSGGLFVNNTTATARLTNTILATNTATTAGATIASDCLTSTTVTAAHDLIGTGAGCTGPSNGSNGNQVGTTAHPINPQLGPLTTNGGPTPTQALIAGSPAIRAGDPTDCQAAPVSNLDQRGDPRHADTRTTCDSGAYDTGGQAPAPLAVTTTSLPVGQVGKTYSATLTASGVNGPFTWSLAAGKLPAGLSLNTTGTITGTPSAVGASTFTVTATDSATPTPHTATAALSITVAPLTIAAGTLPVGQVGALYFAALAASGGIGPYRWSLAAGKLPTGVSLNTTGTMTGTPTAAGTSNFTVQVTDSSSPTPATATTALSITINPAPLTVATATLPAGQTGTAYTATLAASAGTGPYRWSLAAGSLPAGLSLSTTGTITGTPGAAAGTSNFTVQVTDSSSPTPATATRALSITINPAPVTVTTTSLSSGQVGNPYSAALTANGGVPGYTWTLTGGSLPDGLSLASTGAITGTPIASGTFTLAVKATDSASPTAATANATLSLSITVAPGVYVANEAADSISEFPLGAAGNIAPYLTITGPATGLHQPAGVILDAVGRTYVANQGSNTVTEYDPGAHGNATPVATITGIPSPRALTLDAANHLFVATPGGTIYEFSPGAAGGAAPVTTIGGQHTPEGLAFDAAGTLYVSEASTSTINEYNIGTGGAATLIRTLSGAATGLSLPQSLVIDPTGHLTVANAGNATITIYAAGAANDTAPVAVLGSGVQDPVGLDRGSDLTVFVGDVGRQAIIEYASGASTPTITIAGDQTGLNTPTSVAATPPLSIQTTSLPHATVGNRYLTNLVAAEGTTPYTWQLLHGKLPAGLHLTRSGSITGIPRGACGSYHFLVRARDATHPRQTATQTLLIQVG